MQTRRQFLAQSSALTLAGGIIAAAGAQLAFAEISKNVSLGSRPLRILILGGTGYIGPYHVRAALDRGHEVTVFGRGKTASDLPPNVERLTGDRNGDLESLKNRNWDAVLDLATYVPKWVRTLGEAIGDHVGHYIFISTVATYEHPRAHEEITERSPVLSYSGNEDPYSLSAPRNVNEYGALKVLCEHEAETQFPGRVLVMRPGYIVGPHDPQAFFTFLPARFAKGGKVLVCGDPSTPVQFIDVRDLADNVIDFVEKQVTGVYNTVGPAARTTLSQLVRSASAFAPASTQPVWIPAPWLAAQPDRDMWGKLLFWTYLEPEGWAWAMRIGVDRAAASGLKLRPLRVTLADTLNWYQRLSADEQAKLLSVTSRKMGHDGFDVDLEPLSWSTYLQREKELVHSWHAQQSRRG